MLFDPVVFRRSALVPVAASPPPLCCCYQEHFTISGVGVTDKIELERKSTVGRVVVAG